MEEKSVRFLKIFGYILIALFIGGIITIYASSSAQNKPFYDHYWGITISGWYLITGIGILARKRWGYFLFNFFLYVLLLAFPIGTIISYKSLRYIESNNIQNLFRNSLKMSR